MSYILSSTSHNLTEIIEDCKTAFDSSAIEADNENYSSGSTYFISAGSSAKCGLERLALDIFHHNVETRKLTFQEDISGAEWWTQVIDSRDDIGFHWDRDYGLEMRNGQCKYPKIATVTYLSSAGGPTIVMNKKGTDCIFTDDIAGVISDYYLCSPCVGKHLSFDGSLLHAAPSDLLPPEEDDGNSDSSDDRAADCEPVIQRITFLVNIWIDHVPESSVPFSKVGRMRFHYPSDPTKSPFKVLSSNQEDKEHQSSVGSAVSDSAHRVVLRSEDCPVALTFHFHYGNSSSREGTTAVASDEDEEEEEEEEGEEDGEGEEESAEPVEEEPPAGSEYTVTIPSPPSERMTALAELARSRIVQVSFLDEKARADDCNRFGISIQRTHAIDKVQEKPSKATSAAESVLVDEGWDLRRVSNDSTCAVLEEGSRGDFVEDTDWIDSERAHLATKGPRKRRGSFT